MYIDTHTKASMEHSLCSYLNISMRELFELFDKAGKSAHTDTFFNGFIFEDVVNAFIDFKIPNKALSQILLFHLGRRLNAAEDCYTGMNLFDLLSKKTAMSIFLKEHDVEFLPDDGQLNLYYKGKLIALENTSEGHKQYLQHRLGHNKNLNKNLIDYCFNGFMFKDLLYKNRYIQGLSYAPEFIRMLAVFLKCDDIVIDYNKNSKYFCYEYCVPVNKVLFDDKKILNNIGKQKHIINQVIHRLYYYNVTNIRNMQDDDNPILRLTDKDTMKEQFFITKKEIII